MNNREFQVPRDTIRVLDNDFPTPWNGYRFGRPTDFSEYFNDFQIFTPAEWTLTTVGAGTAVIISQANGILRLLNSGADNDNTNIQLFKAAGTSLANASFQARGGKNLFFETILNISDATQSDMAAGLIVTGSADVIGTPPANGIYFRKDDGDTQLDFVCTAGGISSVVSNIALLQNNIFVRLGFKLTDTSLVEFFVDDVKKGEFNSNIPTSVLTPTFQIQNGDANARQMLVDALFISQER